ncbi:carbohydrate ABC transporter permease [Pseudalkalibacillus hwajinpoensis]|uniref:carbohydrate ABC transporter permease n=1 Tax=Guptibacillus hwajinpoensis TaxID=208199 RepID=UPI001CD5FE53|nr:carbohydrate ABC transporter permease [Pseudalkalibacillus hwajinpoensis]MCA0991356.1 carbohydrate ABC transporter permease [Pseudalkalibacillus hwajinpoensis]
MKKSFFEPSRGFKVFNVILFTVFGFVTFYPFWYVFVGSIIPFTELSSKVILLYPENITFEAYKQIFSSSSIPNALKINVIVTVGGTILNLLFTTLAAYVFTKKELPARNFWFSLAIFTMLFNSGLIPMYVTLSNYGLIDSLWVYILPTLINTYYMIIMKTSFEQLPKELEESAKIDGCNEIGILFRIIIPISLPIMATIGLFYAVDRWNELFTAIFFINDENKVTLQAVLYRMLQSTDPTMSEPTIGEGGAAMLPEQLKYASIIVATLPILAVYPFLQRFFVKGVLIGSVKG